MLAISPLGTVGAFFSGFATATFFAVGPVYAVRSGLDTDDVATFMALGVLPAIVLQLPLGRLSDRLDRRSVLIAMAVRLPSLPRSRCKRGAARAGLLCCRRLYGGLSLTMYALCVSHINDHLHPEQMVAASATVLLLNGVGVRARPDPRVGGDGAHAAERVLRLRHRDARGVRAVRRLAQAQNGADSGRSEDAFRGAPPQVAPTGRFAAVAPEGEPPQRAS